MEYILFEYMRFTIQREGPTVSRVPVNNLAVIIAVAALGATLSGCGSSSTSAPSSSTPSASAATSAAAASGTLASVCPQIDAIMTGNADSDPAGTAQKLDEIKAKVTTPDADLIDAVAAAYADIANNPNVPADQPAGQQMITTLSDASKALGSACQSTSSAPNP